MNKSGNNIRIEKQGRKGYMRNMAPLDFKSRISEKPGDIMSIASNEVITIPPTMPVIGAVKTMLNHGFRRIPVADAGTKSPERDRYITGYCGFPWRRKKKSDS